MNDTSLARGTVLCTYSIAPAEGICTFSVPLVAESGRALVTFWRADRGGPWRSPSAPWRLRGWCPRRPSRSGRPPRPPRWAPPVRHAPPRPPAGRQRSPESLSSAPGRGTLYMEWNELSLGTQCLVSKSSRITQGWVLSPLFSMWHGCLISLSLFPSLSPSLFLCLSLCLSASFFLCVCFSLHLYFFVSLCVCQPLSFSVCVSLSISRVCFSVCLSLSLSPSFSLCLCCSHTHAHTYTERHTYTHTHTHTQLFSWHFYPKRLSVD